VRQIPSIIRACGALRVRQISGRGYGTAPVLRKMFCIVLPYLFGKLVESHSVFFVGLVRV
jgi:hypothetical protein